MPGLHRGAPPHRGTALRPLRGADGIYRRVRPAPGAEPRPALDLLAKEAATWTRPGAERSQEELPFRPQRSNRNRPKVRGSEGPRVADQDS